MMQNRCMESFMAPHTVYSAFVNYHMLLGLETACFLCVTRFYDLDLYVMEQIPEMHSFSNEILLFRYSFSITMNQFGHYLSVAYSLHCKSVLIDLSVIQGNPEIG